MASVSVKFTGEWKKLALITDPSKMSPILRKYVGRATSRNAYLAAAAIRKAIRAGGFTANAPLTVAVKRSSKPLVDNGELFKAVTVGIHGWRSAFAGLIRMSDDPKDPANIGLVLHEGTTMEVTGEMRALFDFLFKVTVRGHSPSILTGRAKELYERNPTAKWYPLKETTVAIVIPGRPFVKEAMTPELKEQILQNWTQAVEDAYTSAG